MAPQCRAHSCPIINPPSSTRRRRHTLLPSSPRPVKKSSYQSAAVAGRRFAAAPPTKGARAAIASVWMRQLRGRTMSQVDTPRCGETTQRFGPAASDRSSVLLRSGAEARSTQTEPTEIRLHSQWFQHRRLNIFIDLANTSECVKVQTDCV